MYHPTQNKQNGFVLATMIVLSTVMLIIGVTILQTIISIVSTYNDSYYSSIATQAGEAGIVLANSCVNKNDHQQTWTPNADPALDKSLKQNTDCTGTAISGTRPYVLNEPSVRSSFSVGDLIVRVDGVIIMKATGIVETKNSSGAWTVKKQTIVNQILTWETDYQGSATSSGWKRTCGVISKNAYCWGQENQYGQLGDGTTTPSATPVKVVKEPGVLLGQTTEQISSGLYHNCVISAGKIYCWGDNRAGQLGVGDVTQREKPVPVGGLLAGKTITAMATSLFSTCAIYNGDVYCWGSNQYGQLGTGSSDTTTAVTTPQKITGLPAGQATMLSSAGAGAATTCAVAAGDVYCWGDGRYGQLGNGTFGSSAFSNVPIAVAKEAGILAGKTITALTGDAPYSGSTTQYGHICAVASAKAYCWGSNRFGETGVGGTSDQYGERPAPVDTSVMSGPVTDIMAGASHTCALSEGKAYCWGAQNYGQLGNGIVDTSGNYQKTPVAVIPDPAKNQLGDFKNENLSGLGGGFNRGCAVYSTRTYCWGNNSDGQIGDGTSGNVRSYPTESIFLRPKAPTFLF